MDVARWDKLVDAHAVLTELQAQTSNLVADVLDSYTADSAGHRARLGRIVDLRRQVTTLLALTEDALDDLHAAIEAVEPPRSLPSP